VLSPHPVTHAAVMIVAATVLAVGFPVRSGAAPADGLAAALRRIVSDDKLAGAVAVLRDGAHTHQSSAGESDLQSHSEFPPEVHVRIASITKTFAAATILQMVADGLIGLDAPVDEYLPGRLRGAGIDGRLITVRELLAHRSGLPEYFDDPTGLDLTGTTADDVLDKALGQPAQFAAGSEYKYTNTNYVVIALIIATVSGRSAEDEVARRVLAPLGLSHSYFPATGERGLRAPFAHGYEVSHGAPVDVTDDPGSAVTLDGNLVSTGEDVTTFLVALLDGRVVPDQQLREMMATVPLGHDSAQRYGLGLSATTLSCGVTVWGHTGDGPGYLSVMAEPLGGPAVAVTFTQSTSAAQGDPRRDVLESLYCPKG
jgi:D-alanyl-D-alanine carboxypeptidase